MPEINIDSIPSNIPLDDDAILDQYLDFSDLEAKYHSALNSQFETVIVVDGAPIIGIDKKDRLLSVIRRLFAKEDIHIHENEIFMPFEDDGNGQPMSQGFLFVDCKTVEDAKKAMKQIHLYQIDKLHTLQVNKFLDIENYSNVPENWVESKTKESENPPVETGFIKDWLLDSKARNQIAILHQHITTILWSNKGGSTKTIINRPGWTDMHFTFSPLGSYFVTFHKQGVAVFGGPTMQRIHRFHHPGVSHIDFSPNESYLVTYSPMPLPLPTLENSWGIESVGHRFIIWNMATGKLMRSFPLATETLSCLPWPYFKWSWDEKYFANIVGNKKLSVYETPSFGLLEKKSIAIPDIAEFEWIPYLAEDQFRLPLSTDKKNKKDTLCCIERHTLIPPHCIAYFVPDVGDQLPAQLVLFDVSKREKVRQKQLFYARTAKIHINQTGDYVLFKVDRSKVVGKSVWTGLEMFRLKEKGIPCDSLDLQHNFLSLGLDPMGDSLVVLTTPDAVGPKASPIGKVHAHFYSIEKPVITKGSEHTLPGSIKLIKTIERGRFLNAILWSPKGRFVILTNLTSINSFVEFYDTQGSTSGKLTTVTDIHGQSVTSEAQLNRVRLLGEFVSQLCNTVSWEHAGRYVLIGSTAKDKHQETTYFLTDPQGTILHRQSLQNMRQILWRPHPPTFLPANQLNQLFKKLKIYGKDFDAQDASESNATAAQQKRDRQKLYDEWILFASEALLHIPAVSEIKL
ncbi:Translation initiation factor 3 subunit b [Coelomomyces lativittatus]|nr:Translation initiation factor 3 subunit b [Coelomomyces lativittatus]KAJ1507409.1 Translation initiation factor 3 subunit b [Coelomomyces lativittatus]KAJ1514069.1 Translation initiation factor 3 subunit b [Coelomomyces lativittatus]